MAPALRITIGGTHKAGKNVRIRCRASDPAGRIDHVTVDYGDRSAKSRKTTTRHRYRRGSFTLKVAAVDRAGNVTRKQVRLRIRA